jgi:hypothetical protein
VVRRRGLGRRLEDHERRHDLHADLRRPAVLLDWRDHASTRSAPTSSGSARARTSAGDTSAGGTASIAASTPGAPGSAWGSGSHSTSARSSWIPRDGDVVLVAAEGPLWSAGGERGVYRTTDGGATWKGVLQIDEHTGVTDLEFDPSNPDVVYAAAYQRRRHVWGFLAGGPRSGIWKSTDNGRTWRDVTSGTPEAATWARLGLPSRRRIRTSSTPPSRPARRSAGSTGRATRARAGSAQQLHLGRHGPALLSGDRGVPCQRRRRLPDGRVPERHARRRQNLQRWPKRATTSTATTTRSGSIPPIRATSSSAPMPASTRASTMACAGGTSRTCRSRSSTRSR